MEDQSNSKNSVYAFLIVQDKPQRCVSVAVFEEHTRLFQICSFLDNEHYSNLESLVIQINPKEDDVRFKINMIVKTNIVSEREKIYDKVSEVNYTVHEPHKITSTNLQTALQFLLKTPFNHHFQVISSKKGLQALEKLLTLLALGGDQTNRKEFELVLLKLETFMKLDKPVINALQIFPKDMGKKIVTGTATLFQILNKCKTPIGTRCLKRWMKQPLQKLDQLQRRLDKVEYFLKNASIRNTIQNELRKVPDLDALYYIFYKVKSGKKKTNVEIQDIIKIYRTIKVLDQMLSTLDDRSNKDQILQTIIKEVGISVKKMLTISKMVEENLIIEDKERECHVRPNSQHDLLVISREKEKTEKKIDKHILEVQKQLGGKSVEKVFSSVHRFVIEVDKKHSIQTVKERQDYKFLSAKQTKITFTTQDLISLCKQYTTLQQEYKQKEQNVLNEMFGIVAGYYPVMEKLSVILSQLDILTTFATVVNTYSHGNTLWCRPKFTSGIVGKNLHHPCVKTCVPNDCEIVDQKTIILTGPNMGGKSTYIRTVGVATYLAHIGCYVPASSFETPIIDCIITRVGASDMQMKGISTFMSQMIQTSCMLQIATSNSLVLIDELGRGTSTSQGFGIAWAICSELHQKKNPFCLFATHYHEMTNMEQEIDTVKNMFTSCKIQRNELKLEYKVIDGAMKKSYGIEVAKILKFPQSIIKKAQQNLRLYERQQGNQNSKLQAIQIYKKMKTQLQGCSEQEAQILKAEYKKKLRQLVVM